MPQVKQSSKPKRATKASVSALGAAGLTFSLFGSAAASAVPTADVPQTAPFARNEAITLGEEEMADISLATFYVFDKENVGSDVQVAYAEVAVAAEVVVGARSAAARSGAAQSAPVRSAARAAAVAHLGELAACAKFPRLTNDRQNLTNCRKRRHAGGPQRIIGRTSQIHPG